MVTYRDRQLLEAGYQAAQIETLLTNGQRSRARYHETKMILCLKEAYPEGVPEELLDRMCVGSTVPPRAI